MCYERNFRVYVVNCDLYDGDLYNLSNEEFMDIAEEQGSVYSLAGFQYAYNQDNLFIRFIEV